MSAAQLPQNTVEQEELIFSPLAEPADIARWDRRAAAEYALPTLLLMENAARAALQALEEFYGSDPESGGNGWHGLEALVLAGGGNNGGDGIALARHLHNLGCRVRLFTLLAPGRYKGICRAHLNMARKAGLKPRQLRLPAPKNMTEGETAAQNEDYLEKLTRAALRQFEEAGAAAPANAQAPQIVVDAITGAGFKAPLRPAALAAVRAVNILRQRGSFVLALDIPSGLNALDGRPQPEAVRASATLAFAAAKPGLCLPWAKDYTGALQVREIGLPANLLRDDPSSWRLVAPRPGALPAPDHRIHKAQKGRVLVIGGSAGLTGAPALAALGAARAGAGLVTVAAPAGLSREIKHGLPEIMTLPLAPPLTLPPPLTEADRSNDCNWQAAHLDPLLEHINGLAGSGRQAALVLGPGLGRAAFVANLLRAVLELPQRPPLVLDADGLFFFRLEPAPGGKTLPLSLLRPGDVITPHAGEMLRLLGKDENPAACAEYGKLLELPERLAALRRLCAACPAVLLLKGAGTLIAQNPVEAGKVNKTGEIGEMRETGEAAETGGAKFPVALAPFAESNLAVGGSGDVLSGLIAALLARGVPALSAACLGAHAHGRAGQLTRRSFPVGGNLASDIADQLSLALRELGRP